MAEENKNENDARSFLEKLQIELLLSVLVYFLTAWVLLNNKICSFTGAEVHNVQICYIFVHYVLTVTIILCLFLTAVKSYIISSSNQVGDWIIKLFKLLLEGWYWIIAICILAIALSGIYEYEWVCFALIFFAFIAGKMNKLHFKKRTIALTIPALAYLFLIFISCMTVMVKDVTLEPDKSYYAPTDRVMITVHTRGYACNYKLIGMGSKIGNIDYFANEDLLIFDAAQLKGSEIAVGTLSPATGLKQFFISYPISKILDKEPEYLQFDYRDLSLVRKYCTLTEGSIYVTP